MKLRWTRPALADLIEAQSYIALDNPQAAHRVAQRVWDAAARLRDNPNIGRVGHVLGTHEWVVMQTPYLLVFRIKLTPWKFSVFGTRNAIGVTNRSNNKPGCYRR